jgi:uncharacterized membrane protein YgcG
MPNEQDEVVKIVVEVVDKFTKPLEDMRKHLAGVGDNAPDSEKLQKHFHNLRTAANSVGSALNLTLLPALRGLGFSFVTIAAAIYGAVSALKEFAGNLDTLSRLSRETGLTIDNMRELEAVGRRVGATTAEMRQGFRDFAAEMHKIRAHTQSETLIGLRGVGLNEYADRLSKAKTTAEAEALMFQELDKIRDPDERRRFLQLHFFPPEFAAATRAERERLVAEYRKQVGQTDKAAIDASKKFVDSMQSIGNAWESITKQMARDGTLETAVTGLEGAIGAVDKINEAIRAIVGPGSLGDKLFGPKSETSHAPKSPGRPLTIWEQLFGMGFRTVDPEHPAASPQSDEKTQDIIKQGTSAGVVDGLKKMALDTGGGDGTFGGASVIRASLGGGRSRGGGGANESEPAPGGRANIPGGRRAVAGAVVDELRKGGLSEEAIAGILANIGSESSFDPTLRHPDQPGYGGEAHYAHGLYQEGGAEWNNYSRWLRENHPGKSWQDPRLQTQFLLHRLQTGYPKLWEKLKRLGRTAAAIAFLREYLKPAQRHQNERARQYQRGLPGVEDYTGPQTPPATAKPQRDKPPAPPPPPRERLQEASIDHPLRTEGGASVRVELNGFPRGTRTSTEASGVFNAIETHRGKVLSEPA